MSFIKEESKRSVGISGSESLSLVKGIHILRGTAGLKQAFLTSAGKPEALQSRHTVTSLRRVGHHQVRSVLRKSVM